MANRQKNYGYANQSKKPMDKSKYQTWPCDKGYKCPYRKLDDDGTMLKNYCTFIHHPHDLCPDKEDCQFFQTQDCVWKHSTKPKPKPKPIPVVQLKPPVTQIVKNQDQFPSIGGNNNKKKTASLPPKNIVPDNTNIALNNTNIALNNNNNKDNNTNNKDNNTNDKDNNTNNKDKKTINKDCQLENAPNSSASPVNNNITNFNYDKKCQNTKTNNPESNSYLVVKLAPQTLKQVKYQTHKNLLQSQVKLQQQKQKQKITQKPSQLLKISPQIPKSPQTPKSPQMPKYYLQKSSPPFITPIFQTNQPKQQMPSQGPSHLTLHRLQNRENNEVTQRQRQRQPEANTPNFNTYYLPQKKIQITRQIQQLAKQVLQYNISKRQCDYGDYQNNIRLSQILKLSNDLRQVAKFSSLYQPQNIHPNISEALSETENQFTSNNFRHLQRQPSQKAQLSLVTRSSRYIGGKNLNTQNLSNQTINSFISPLNWNQNTKPEELNEKGFNKRILLSAEQISQLSIDSRQPILSQYLLSAFLEFITDKNQIEFRFEVHKKKLEIVQKYFNLDHNKNKQQRQSFYSVEVLEQSYFQQLCETITQYSYTPKKQNNSQKSFKNQNSPSFIKTQDSQQLEQNPKKVIQQFFEHLFEYLQFYFKKIKKECKDKTLQALDVFYKTVILPEELIPANSPQVSIQDPYHFKGPIYVGGMRNICMRFFARIFLLFLQNNVYAAMKVKELMNRKSLNFDEKTITKFMQEKQEETVKRLTGNRYKDNIECNKKKRPMDRQLIEWEVKSIFVPEMIARSHHLIDQIMLGEKDALLSWQSMKQYIELKTHQYIFMDQETEVDVGKIEMINIICKGQIWIEGSDRKKYNQKQKNRFSFLESYFMEQAVNNDFEHQHNEYIINKKIQIGQKSYVTIYSDGKYIIEQPFDEHRIQQYQDQINAKLKEKNPKNPPNHQTKIFYYAVGNTGLSTCSLESIASDPFFKNKILQFTEDSPFLVYCNQEHGFYGSESFDSFKIRIYRQGGTIDFWNVKSQEQCKRYFGFICDIIKNSKAKTSQKPYKPLYFSLTTQPQNGAVATSTQKDQISQWFSMQPKQKRCTSYKKQNLSIITWNLKRIFESDLIHRQISWNLRLKSIVNDLKTRKADIVCLQEVKDFKKQLYKELCEENQLYFMPFHADVGDYQTLIMTRFPVKYFTIKIASQKWACCEFEIQTWTQPQDSTQQREKMNEIQRESQELKTKQFKKLSVLVMSVHLKCTQLDSEDNFLASNLTREKQLKNLDAFFSFNENENDKKYDLVIMAGDFNIDDEAAEYKEDGEILHSCDHNQKYLRQLPYFDLQAELHPQTLQTCKTYLHKGQMENKKYKIGGSRLDRIIVRAHSSIDVKEIISELSELSLVGDYSVRSKQNVNEVNYDKFTRSPSDHFGVYMEIPFNI